MMKSSILVLSFLFAISVSAKASELDAMTTAVVKALVAKCIVADTTKVSCESVTVDGHEKTITYAWKILPECSTVLHVSKTSPSQEGGVLQTGSITLKDLNLAITADVAGGIDTDEYTLKIGTASYSGVNDCVSDGLDALKEVFGEK